MGAKKEKSNSKPNISAVLAAIKTIRNDMGNFENRVNSKFDVMTNEFGILENKMSTESSNLEKRINNKFDLQGKELRKLHTGYQKLSIGQDELRGDFQELSTNQKELRTDFQELSTNQKELRTDFQVLSTNQKELRDDFQELVTNQKELRGDFQVLSANQKELRTDFQVLSTSQKELRTDFQGLSTSQKELQTDLKGLRIEMTTGFGSIEKQFQGQRADIIKMKEEILGALDATVQIPDMNSKVQQHDERIESLEQRATVFDLAIRNLNKVP